jgi:hypothetical protein
MAKARPEVACDGSVIGYEGREVADNPTFQAQRDSMDSISMSRLCKSQAAVGGAIDEISSRLIVFDYRNTQPRVRQ